MAVVRPDVPAKPAVVVGLAQAQASKSRGKRATAAPPPPSSAPERRAGPTQPPPLAGRPPPRRPVPAPFADEPTRQVDDDVLAALRAHDDKHGAPRRQAAPTFLPTKAVPPPFNDEQTRMSPIDPRAYDETGVALDGPDEHIAKFLAQAPATDPELGGPETHDEATRMSSLEAIAAMERVRNQPSAEERTRAVNIRHDNSISDIDWDLD